MIWFSFILAIVCPHVSVGQLPLHIKTEYFLQLAGKSLFYPLLTPHPFSLNSSSAEGTTAAAAHVLVVVPGHNCDYERTKIILNNLLILNHSIADVKRIECLIFLSCQPPEHIRQKLAQSCDLHTYEPGSYGHYLKAIVPLFLKQAGVSHVLILLDDAQLSYNYRLDVLLHLMQRYSLSAISPSVINAVYPSTSCSFCNPRLRTKLPPSLQTSIHPINRPPPLPPQPIDSLPPIGYTTDAIEMFATLFTLRAWRCFHSMLQPAFNSAGWSYDRCFKKYCMQKENTRFRSQRSSSVNSKNSVNITLGIVDSMIVLHNSARQVDNEKDSIDGVPKPAIERNNWLQALNMHQFLSPEDVFGEVMTA
jgi:hypothetical protein